jgi:HSP20 family protein
MFSLTPWRKDRDGSGALANRTEHPLSLFRSEFDSLFDRFFGNWPALEPNWVGWGLDLDETDSEVTVRVDAPGFEPGDFDIQVSGDTLRISAERKAEKGKNGSYERRFQRSVTLPAAVNADKVEAKYRNGVLELTLPKTEQAKWKKIPVKA